MRVLGIVLNCVSSVKHSNEAGTPEICPVWSWKITRSIRSTNHVGGRVYDVQTFFLSLKKHTDV